MRRRGFIAALGGAAAWPMIAHAQRPEGVRRIGVLTGRSEDPESLSWIEAMRQRLRQLGWIDGRNIEIDFRAEVQGPTKYELIINLKTAKALSLNVPQTMVARAQEVIE